MPSQNLDRARDIARVARAFGMSMAEVRSMTLRDLVAMSDVVREERSEAQRASQARQRLAAARKGHRG